MGYVCRSRFSRQLNSFCIKIPMLLYSAEQGRSLCSWGKQQLGLLICSHCLWGTPLTKHTYLPLHTRTWKGLSHTTHTETRPLLPAMINTKCQKKPHEGIKLEKGSSIEKVSSAQDTLSHSNKHFTSKGQQFGKLRTLCKGHSQEKDHEVKKSLLINDKFSTCCYNYKDNSSFMSVPLVLQL